MTTHTPSRPDPADPERREALAALGRATAAAIVAAALPRLTTGTAFAATAGEWAAWTNAARGAVASGVDAWAADSTIQGGEINGSALFLAPGTLDGPSFAPAVQQAVVAAGAPPQVADALAQALWQPWATWSHDYTLFVPKAMKAFAAVAASEVGPTPLATRPLKKGSAPGRIALTPDVLREIVLQLVPGMNEPTAGAALAALVGWYTGEFAKWYRGAKLANLVMSRGPVPTFAPPYVPVGPVVGGDVIGLRVIEAAPFGA
ncbi:MAG: hypothetical protein IT294_18090 [Deltaproteobacteria bacterium]|nr:hypothetical protein [Deltaproteobacteria bacterium]